MFPRERFALMEALIPLLHDTPHWDIRFDIEWYVSKCMAAGFCKTQDQIRLCAERYLAGKRKITPPGTKRRKVAEKERKKLKASVPSELMKAVNEAIAEGAKAIAQYKSGVEKALNAVVGGVMKRHKADPAFVRELILEKIA